MASAPRSTAADPNEAYARFTSMVDPNAPREEMEAAITEAYAGVPGFQGAYKESVNIDGTWFDLVGAYGSPKASFHGMMAKRESSPGKYGMTSMASLGGYGGSSAIRTPASQGMPAMARPEPTPLPAVARAAYAPLAAPMMANLAHPEAA